MLHFTAAFCRADAACFKESVFVIVKLLRTHEQQGNRNRKQWFVLSFWTEEKESERRLQRERRGINFTDPEDSFWSCFSASPAAAIFLKSSSDVWARQTIPMFGHNSSHIPVYVFCLAGYFLLHTAELPPPPFFFLRVETMLCLWSVRQWHSTKCGFLLLQRDI